LNIRNENFNWLTCGGVEVLKYLCIASNAIKGFLTGIKEQIAFADAEIICCFD
jgi:hypothetical protein